MGGPVLPRARRGGDERLIFCPHWPCRAARIVTADVLAPLQAGPVEWWKAAASRPNGRRDIFKFPAEPVNVREGLAP
jgi:hypothetical protein